MLARNRIAFRFRFEGGVDCLLNPPDKAEALRRIDQLGARFGAPGKIRVKDDVRTAETMDRLFGSPAMKSFSGPGSTARQSVTDGWSARSFSSQPSKSLEYLAVSLHLKPNVTRSLRRDLSAKLSR